MCRLPATEYKCKDTKSCSYTVWHLAMHGVAIATSIATELSLILLAAQTYLQGRSISRSRKISSLESRPEG